MKRVVGALLCGGLSSRMGRDKAMIQLDGQPLWQLQLAKLRLVCSEVIVCGNPAQSDTFEPMDVRFESDAEPGLGPLSGIARAMEIAGASHVLVLAVDMPNMSEHYLSELVECSSAECGAVPERGVVFEGLCAVYPIAMRGVVLGLLAGTQRSVQRLVRLGMEQGFLRAKHVTPFESVFFENWNAPGDVARAMETRGLPSPGSWKSLISPSASCE